MKRKNLAVLATMMVCMTAGCAGNTNSAAVQEASVPSVEETAQQVQESGSAANLESSTVADGQTEAPAQETAVSAGPVETAQQDGEKTIAQVQPNQTPTVMETTPGSISMETAKSIAMKDVGIEYEYEIQASDGTILKKKQDAEWGKNSGIPAGYVAGQPNAAAGQTGAGQSGAAQGVTGYLTMEQARQKVAERIPGVDPANVYIKEDYDDGRLKYEGEVYYNQTKYEFELDAATGAFTDWEEEKGR